MRIVQSGKDKEDLLGRAGSNAVRLSLIGASYWPARGFSVSALCEECPILHDPFNLDRFVKAQAPVFEHVLEELRAGRKQSHWMWFVFPQMRGLGSSPTSSFYGIGSLDEATAYLAHPVLGPRLDETTRLVLDAARSLNEIFGSPDDLKFCSSMTLFARAGEPRNIFADALQAKCGGLDGRTERLLSALKGLGPTA